MKADSAVVADFMQACLHVGKFVKGLTEDEFRESVLEQPAVIRRIEIIGESARRPSAEFRTVHAAVPRKRIVGLRDRLIHGYDDVEPTVAWTVQRNGRPCSAGN